MKLSKIIEKEVKEDQEITNIVYDSRKAKKGTLFVALKGFLNDGHKYVNDAYNQGCRAFLVSDDVELSDDAVVIKAENTRRELSRISANFFSHPSRSMKVIGVTGTKGKTTFCKMMYDILKNSSYKVGLIGSLGVFYNDCFERTVNTTPESFEIQRVLSDMNKSGIEYVVIEVSSLGLKRNRVDDVDFEYGVFTNLGREHIGGTDHPDFEDYLKSKAKLFLKSKNAVIYMDDKYADVVTKGCQGKKLYYGEKDGADLVLDSCDNFVSKEFFGSKFTVFDNEKSETFELSMLGKFNALNATGAVLLSRTLGVSDDILKSTLKNISVSGRCELLYSKNDIRIIMDFAHEGMSMENLLKTLRTITKGKLTAVYGSVGDHAYNRRSQLGTAAGKYSDLSVITTDDPGFESPSKIAEEIAQSVNKVGGKYIVEIDREKAIDKAVSMLEPGDVLALCAKCDEPYMKILGENIPYSERESLNKALEKYNM